MSNDDLLPVRVTRSGYVTGIPAITKENFTCASSVVGVGLQDIANWANQMEVSNSQ